MMQVVPGTFVSVDGIKDTLRELGIDLEDENFKDTPMRWLRYMGEFLQPFDEKACLSTSFTAPEAPEAPAKNAGTYNHALIVQSNIPYQAVCAHHLVPVLGRAHVGYIAHEKVVGLSKLTRLVHGISHRMPSLQEDVGNAIVVALIEHLDAKGAMCVIKAEHGCMACRGVARLGISTSTASLRGFFITRPAARQEFYELVKI